MIRSPRQTFTTSPYRSQMEAISINEAFLTACDAALLTFGEELSNPLDPTAQAQLVGARRVLSILKEIHQKEEAHKPIKTPSLNYDVDHRRP